MRLPEAPHICSRKSRRNLIPDLKTTGADTRAHKCLYGIKLRAKAKHLTHSLLHNSGQSSTPSGMCYSCDPADIVDKHNRKTVCRIDAYYDSRTGRDKSIHSVKVCILTRRSADRLAS